MNNNILKNTPDKKRNIKNGTKIRYLQNELNQMKKYNEDLKIIVNLNKQAIGIAMADQIQGFNENKDQNKNNCSTTISNNTHFSENKRIIDFLLEENKVLQKNVDKLIEEREEAQLKSLIHQQIAEELKIHEEELQIEYEEKIYDFRKHNLEKEYIIQDLEKKISLQVLDNDCLIKYKEVINFSF